ncbi:MAG: GDSL-type esterase/lipase family protein, partial [Acidobacteriota bacterium]|nr:GDSL-type esterase/lipase family protein [Acidobacteriota bacterium]
AVVMALVLSLSTLVAGQTRNNRQKTSALPLHKIENAGALANFFRALRTSQSGQRLEPVRIMHFGDSHIAADILTAQIRRRFQEEFGDGGAGYIVPRNPMTTRRHGATSGATPGWIIEGIGGRVAADGIYAPAGIALATSQANEKAWLQTSANHFEIYYVSQPGGGSIDILVDGASVLDVPISLAARLPRLNHFSYDEPVADNYRVEVRTVAPGKARVLGIVAERLNPGVTYDVLGINGARAARLLSWNAAAFAGVLAQRKPDLIILAFGTNEAGDADWTAEAHQQTLTRIIRRLHTAVPQASILIYGPSERGDVPLAAGRMPAVIAAQRRAALASNVAFWSSFDAMGGPGSLNAWIARGLGQADHVHLTSPGYIRMGDLFYDDLMRAYQSNQ